MSLYRLHLKLKSPLITPLYGDTIWGHVVWGIANNEGSDAVADFLYQNKNDRSFFSVSNAFPHNFLPKPIMYHNNSSSIDISSYTKQKILKKIKYIPSSYFFNADFSFSNETLEEVLKTSNNYIEKTEYSMHNSINRISNTVIDNGLYSVEETWMHQNNKKSYILFDIYTSSTLPKDRIIEIFTWAFENGYGADSSTGKGHIDVDNYIEEIIFPGNYNRLLTLGTCIPTIDEASDVLRYEIFTRSGKIGGVFASTHIPFKKPIILLSAGSIFKYREIDYIGEIIQNVHQDSSICNTAITPVIPFFEKSYE